MAKTSIDIKYLKTGDIEADGGMSLALTDVGDMDENAVIFQGSDPEIKKFKNHKGRIIERSSKEGDKTLEFNITDFTPAVVAKFTGGTVDDTDPLHPIYNGPLDAVDIEQSVEFESIRGVVFSFPRVGISAYPVVSGNELHYIKVKGDVLKPTKADTPDWSYTY